MQTTASYDLVLASPYRYDFFAHHMSQLCGQMRISFLVVNDLWVHEFTAKLRAGEVQVKVLLDLATTQTIPDNPYTVLAREARDRGTYLLDDPERTAEVTHKGYSHQALAENKVPVPESIVVPHDDVTDFVLSEEAKKRIGIPFVVKPARGYGGFGVTMNGRSEEDLRRCARECPDADAFLIQKQLTIQDLGKQKGWFRLFYICGTVIACWWDTETHEYKMVRPSEIKEYKLNQLRSIMRGIARVTKLKKFSSEICLDTDGDFYAVDYVNACPDMNPRSFYANGVPDEVVRYIVWLLFTEAMQTVKRGQGFFDQELQESESAG